MSEEKVKVFTGSRTFNNAGETVKDPKDLLNSVGYTRKDTKCQKVK